jgi:hypothetical protein
VLPLTLRVKRSKPAAPKNRTLEPDGPAPLDEHVPAVGSVTVSILDDDPGLLVRVISAAAMVTVNVTDRHHLLRNFVYPIHRRLVVNVLHLSLADHDPAITVPIMAASGAVTVTAEHHDASAVVIVVFTMLTANVPLWKVNPLHWRRIIVIGAYVETGYPAAAQTDGETSRQYGKRVSNEASHRMFSVTSRTLSARLLVPSTRDRDLR